MPVLLRQKKANFFNTFTPAAREILDTLLEKYADYGVGEFDHLSSVLQVSPFDNYSSPYEIYQLFGGGEDVAGGGCDVEVFVWVR